nr:nitrogenase component 1 [uncultured Mediterraneibacter sp.]
MRGLRKYLTPFAPDQSGAVSVLFELGGILVICDAGGCTGNVCGFDEPRWFERKSAVFSAGLRDMDAILGRDDRLVAKLADAAGKLGTDAKFAAVIGTPVPAVIGTDYQALKRMCEKKTDLPVLAVDANGMELYDAGEEKAYLELFRVFAGKNENKNDFSEKKAGCSEAEEVERVGILGMTPQDMSDLNISERMKKVLWDNEKQKAVCYGMGDGLEEVRRAGTVSRNLVVSPAALKTAKYLEETFGTPYEVTYPLAGELVPDMDYTGKKILIVHQQVIANSIREEIRRRCAEISENEDAAPEVQVAGWFMMKPELKEEQDRSLRDEDDYISLVEQEGYDVIFADGCMKCMTPGHHGVFVNTVHFAVSGKLA